MGKRISKKSTELLNKSIESCLFAVEMYNKPQTKFRSGGYIVLMTIAYTSLFHAVFEKNKTKYYYKKKVSNRYEIIDGERKAWELSECLKEYFKDFNKDELPVRKNIEFFIPLRNQIEHRFMPELDDEIFGECQALLHNFEYILIKEFGEKYALCENLVFSLQFSKNYPLSKEKEISVKQNKGFEKVKNYVMGFRDSLDEKTYLDQKYRFSVYLLPKLIRNKNKAEYSIEWIDYDPEDSEAMKNYERVIGFISEKVKPVSNAGNLRAKDVCKIVESKLKIIYGENFKFSYSTHHYTCCMYYNIRPKKDGSDPKKTNPSFCVYDDVHKDYVYTKEWVDFLVKRLSDREELIKVLPSSKNLVQSLDYEKTSKSISKLEDNKIEAHI